MLLFILIYLVFIQELTLERVKEALNNWRSSKKRANEGIPVALWQQIFELLGKHTETEIRSVLHLTPTQLERGSLLIEETERLNQEFAKSIPNTYTPNNPT